MEKERDAALLYFKFLKLLGLERKSPSLEALSELVNAHFSKIPFENISKIYYKEQFNLQSIPSFSQYLNGISENNFGGTCYANNYFFYKLLQFIGYNVILCGADMKEPDVHIVIIVTLNNFEYLVDVGNASLFLQPLPLFLKKDYTIIEGGNKYILNPRNAQANSKLEIIKHGVSKQGYLVKPIAKNINDFSEAISSSFRYDSIFLNSLLITKYISGKFYSIHNHELTVSKNDNFETRQISGSNELCYLIEKIIKIPASISKTVLNSIVSLKNVWS
jgi:arylamine N-acetyltransferase